MKQIPTTLKHLTYSIFCTFRPQSHCQYLRLKPSKLSPRLQGELLLWHPQFFQRFPFWRSCSKFWVDFWSFIDQKQSSCLASSHEKRESALKGLCHEVIEANWRKAGLKKCNFYQWQNWFSESRKWRHAKFANPWKCKQVSFHEGEIDNFRRMCKLPY